MKKLTQRQAMLFFYGFDILLLLIALIAFVPKSRGKQSVEGSLLEKSSLPYAEKIVLSKPLSEGRESLELYKTENVSFWTGRDSFSSFNYLWPSDSQAVQNFLDELTSVQTMSVKAKGEKFFKRLGVDKDHAFIVTVFDKNDELLTELCFGYDDMLTQKISVVIGSDDTVYEAKSTVKTYLKTNETFWSDPFIFPQCLTNYSRAESEKLLRHGELCMLEPNEDLSADYVLTKDFENGARVKFSLFSYNEEFVVIPVFTAGPAFSPAERDLLERLNYRYLISAWTMQRLTSEAN